MNIDELERDPSSKFVTSVSEPDAQGVESEPQTKVPLALPPSPYEQLIEPLWVGTWKCKACDVWVSGYHPGDFLCKWCLDHKEEIEYIRGEIIDNPNIFPRINDEGKRVFSTVTEDGRVVDLDT
jgi:hypothetical protein